MKIDVSVGELVDKVSILSIKLKKMKNEEKVKNVRQEYDQLRTAMEEDAGIKLESDEFIKLEEINSRLWDIEDRIRIKELKKEFDSGFIELARSIYFYNDERANIKKRINLEFGSSIIEEKEYAEYGKPDFSNKNPT